MPGRWANGYRSSHLSPQTSEHPRSEDFMAWFPNKVFFNLWPGAFQGVILDTLHLLITTIATDEYVRWTLRSLCIPTEMQYWLCYDGNCNVKLEADRSKLAPLIFKVILKNLRIPFSAGHILAPGHFRLGKWHEEEEAEARFSVWQWTNWNWFSAHLRIKFQALPEYVCWQNIGRTQELCNMWIRPLVQHDLGNEILRTMCSNSSGVWSHRLFKTCMLLDVLDSVSSKGDIKPVLFSLRLCW